MSKARLQEVEMGEAMVISLIRDGYWNTLENYCNDSYKKTSDPIYLFWRAFAQHHLANTSGAINDLLSIQQKKEVAYACIVALLYYHNQARNIDRVTRPSPRKKSTISADANAINAGTQQKGPSPTQSTSSPSSEKHGKPTT